MGEDLATANVNRSYSLAATSIAIFTFTLFFLYPRFTSGEAHAILFQATLVVMGVATFAFVFASFYYYCSAVSARIASADRALYCRRADRLWLLGYTLLFLAPNLILFSIGLFAVGSVWLALWLVYLFFVVRYFPKVQTARTRQGLLTLRHRLCGMEITAEQFGRIEPFLPVQRGNVSLSNLQVVNAILHVAENGCKWRALPKRFGNWHAHDGWDRGILLAGIRSRDFRRFSRSDRAGPRRPVTNAARPAPGRAAWLEWR